MIVYDSELILNHFELASELAQTPAQAPKLWETHYETNDSVTFWANIEPAPELAQTQLKPRNR